MALCVYINSVDSTELGLIPTTKDIPSPNPRLYYVDIPGRNGKLDVTDTMGDVTYENITITVNFESFKTDLELRDIFNGLNGKSVILGFLSGSTIEQYTGRMNKYTVKANGATRTCTITVDVSPEVTYVAN